LIRLFMHVVRGHSGAGMQRRNHLLPGQYD
jgi:hypothetical protein